MRTRYASLVLSALFVFVVTPAHAAPCKEQNACDPACERSCADVVLPSAIVLDGKKLCLNGMGVREATVFNVDVYVAGLYLEHRGGEGEAIARSAQPKVMRLRLVRDVDRGEMGEA